MRNLSLLCSLFVTTLFCFSLAAQNQVSANEIISQLNNGQDVSMSNVTITGDLDFRQLNDREAERGNGWGNQEAYRYHVRNRLSFVNCTFEGRVLAYVTEEERVTRNTKAIHNTDFHAAVTFENCRFKEEANFKYTDFDEAISFVGSTFEEFAGFKYTQFQDMASFVGVKLQEKADFKYAEFPESVNFSSAEFGDEATFKYTKFGDAPDFSSAKFRREVSFKYTDFPRGTDFTGTDFGDDADFKYTTLGGKKFRG